MPSDHTLEDLRAKVARLERGLEARQYRAVSAPANLIVLRIIDGQTCFNDGVTIKYGVQRAGGVITSVTTAFDPNGVGATPGLFTADVGIGRAEILLAGGLFSPTLVLVLLDVTSPIDQAILEGEEVWSGSVATIPVSGGGSISAYRLQLP